ncbi:hypothetical protein J6590_090214 [Homalodisca vitripennis]|nr:hypothetical protein J6590_090214 [Homalodisca vitripennis]
MPREIQKEEVYKEPKEEFNKEGRFAWFFVADTIYSNCGVLLHLSADSISLAAVGRQRSDPLPYKFMI